MNKFYIRRITLISIISILPFFVFSQQKYEGEYTFNGLEGEAIFDFIRGEGDRIVRQGEFKFFRREKDREDRTKIYKTRVEGTYQEDKKTGLWDYLDEKHFIEINDVENFRLAYEINSEQIRLKANYKDGIPDGKWIFEENQFLDGKLSPKSVSDDLKFNNGQIEGSFQYKSFVDNATLFIRGELTPDGYMNGEWVMVYFEEEILVSEIRNYENGFLIGLVKRDLNTDEVLEEVVFFDVINKLNQVNNKESKGFRISEDQFGIRFNNAYWSNELEFKAQNSGNEFISNFLTNVLRYDESFVDANGTLIKYPIHTKRFVYELSRTQQRIIEELPEEFERQKRVVRDYSNRNSLRINRQRSDSLAFAHAYFDFRAERLSEIEEFINLLKTKQIQYFDVKEMVDRGIPFIKATDVIEYSFENENKTREIEFDLSKFEEDFYTGMNDYFKQLAESIRSVKGYVDNSLSQIERDEDLRSIESRIQERKEEADGLYSNFEGLNDRQISIIRSVKENIIESAFEDILQEYSRQNIYTDKKQTARIAEDMLEEMIRLHEDLLALPKIEDDLDKLYQEEVFNPFTFSRYDQRAKPRLYETAENLWEYYIDALKKEKDYGQISKWLIKTNDFKNKMEELRFADTRRLENRLNRRMDVKRIESLLDL